MFKKFERLMKNEDIGEYVGYGISCGDDEIEDISTNEEFVDELVDLLNKNDASPIHFRDIVVDYIS